MSATTHGAATPAPTKTMTYADAINEAMAEEMERDETVFLIGQDVGRMGGIFGVTKGLHDRFGARRVVDSPISENFLAGGGVGAAITGLRPIVELQFADFVTIAMDEIQAKAGRWRYMHGGHFKVPLVLRLPEGVVGGAGPEHSACPEALFYSAPGLYAVTPSNPADAKGLLKTAIRDDNPVLFFEHKSLYFTEGEVPTGEHLVPLDQAAVARAGDDVTVVAWSLMVGRALEAAETLAGEGISVEVIDPRGIAPFDTGTILESVAKTGHVVLVHEAAKTGGPGSEVAAILAEEAITDLDGPIVRVAAPDIPMPQNRALEPLLLPTAADIVAGIRRTLG
jgi:acetoin:2,6-dichlorophenolindophenol oxidoreductase subunit beta